MVWGRGGDAWYDYAIRVYPRSPLTLDDAASRVKTPWMAAELRKMAAERRAELAAEYEANRQRAAADLAAQQRATQNYSSGFSGAGGSSLSVPPLSQQQQDYRSGVQLNKSIYGTSWDPYK